MSRETQGVNSRSADDLPARDRPLSERAKRWKENANRNSLQAESELSPAMQREVTKLDAAPWFGPTAWFFIGAIIIVALGLLGKLFHLY